MDISNLISAVATAVVAIFSWRSYVIAKQMKGIASDTVELTKQINIKNSIEEENTNKIFWAIVVSNLLTDLNSSHVKYRFGLLIYLFGYEKIKKEIGLDGKGFFDIGAKNWEKYFDDIVRNLDNK